MYAVIKTGGKQYKVAAGDLLKIEKIEGEVGSEITLDNVLLVADGDSVTVGAPQVEGAKVSARIVEQDRGKKLIVFKKKRRKGYSLKKGHRQYYTAVKIEKISA